MTETKKHCLRCGYNWTSRKKVVRVCAHCRSPYWDRPRKEKNSEIENRLNKLKQSLS